MGILGSLFGGGGGTTKIGKKAAKELWGRATAVADKPYVAYEGERVAPITGSLQSAISAAGKAGNAGSGAINRATSLADTLTGFKPTLFQGSSLSPVTPMTAAQIDPNNVSRVTGQSFLDADISGYMNPYITNVVDQTIAAQELARQRQGLADSAAAVRAGAFGGSRQAVASALTNEAYDRNTGAMIADLYKSGFDTASGLFTSDANRALAAGQSNQATDLAMATTNAGNQQQAGLANQTVQYNTALQNATLAQEAAKANQQAQLTANEQAWTGAGILGDIGNNQAKNAAAAADVAMKAGAMEQTIAQKRADAAYEAYLREQGWSPEMIRMLVNAGGVVAGTSKGQSSGLLGGAMEAVGAVGEAGGLGKIFGGLF